MIRSNWFHVLVALTRRPLHGAAIAEDVLERTEGSLRLWPATLYRALDELVDAGFAEELAESERPEGESRRKRYYRITAAGRDAMTREVERLEAFARDARARLKSSS